jgi:hypothetical protein
MREKVKKISRFVAEHNLKVKAVKYNSKDGFWHVTVDRHGDYKTYLRWYSKKQNKALEYCYHPEDIFIFFESFRGVK